ncbi:GAF domain-containing protein [Serratia marcescens]
MLEPCFPENEAERLSVLNSLNVLDSNSVEKLDRITRLAAKYFGVTIALVSLIDRDRQWFLSRYGLDARETPRNISFCGHAILQREALVVPDTANDPRFFDNPLVIGDRGSVSTLGNRCCRSTGCRSAPCALSTASRSRFPRNNWPTCTTSPPWWRSICRALNATSIPKT